MAISKSYVGIGNETKEIKSVYVGYNNKAILLPIFASGGGLPEIVTWHDGTDEQIVAMVAAADAGLMNLSDYWAVGDERDVSLSAMSATGVGESHVAQDVVLVLCDANNQNYEYVTPTSGRTYCNFVVQQEDLLSSNNTSTVGCGYMNSSNTNSGSWNNCARRTWCNNVYYNAIPSTIRSIFKQVKVKTIAAYNGSTIQTSNDYFFLPAEREIFDSRTNSNQTEWNSLTQWNYYKTTANRVKHLHSQRGSAYNWWERSPIYFDSLYFCIVDYDGSAKLSTASYSNGIAPAGAI